MAQSTPGVTGPAMPVAGVPELYSPAQVAQMLGVGEADVLASLDAGDLKGRKIGAQWRVTRRAALAIVGCALLASFTVSAQDPRAAIVQRAAREWLALADTLDAAATWKAAGAGFQKAMPLGRWAAALKSEREGRGPVVQRAIMATTFGSSFPGLPEGGNYALVKFRTAFANESAGAEHLTLEVGADYAWHVIGYVIQ